MKQHPHAQEIIVSAKALVVNDGKLLLLRRSSSDPRRPLTWDFPGGVVEAGENPETSCRRETQEEAGIALGNLEIFAVRHSPPDNDKPAVLRLFYTGEVVDQKITLSFEHDKFEWIDPAEAEHYDMPELYLELISSAFHKNVH
jgi:8-oxo-dGTP diphosphatase